MGGGGRDGGALRGEGMGALRGEGGVGGHGRLLCGPWGIKRVLSKRLKEKRRLTPRWEQRPRHGFAVIFVSCSDDHRQ